MEAIYDPTGRADFAVQGKVGVYHPKGETSPGQLADMMTFAVQRALTEGLSAVVLNITDVTGFDSPGPAYRRWLVSRWAELAGNRIRVAVVARNEHICPEKTGLVAAAEEGLRANVFNESESEALAWLEGNRPPAPDENRSRLPRRPN
jgi:hypothetical protein